MFCLLSSGVFAQQVDENYEKASTAFFDDKFDEAYIYLKNSLSKDENHLPSKILMGKVLALSFYYEDAVVEFEESLQQGADPNLFLEFYANSLLQSRQYEQILSLSFGNLTNKNQAILNSIQAIASLQNSPEKAGGLFKKAVELAPNLPSILNSYTRYLLNEDNLDEAISINNQSYQLDQKNTETLRLKARIALFNSDDQSYLKILERALDINPAQPFVLRDAVFAYIGLSEYESALALINKTLNEVANDPMARLLKSYVQNQLGQSDQAQTMLEHLVNDLSQFDLSLDKGNVSLLYVSALANYAVNNIEKARTEFASYLLARPDDLRAVLILAEIFASEQKFTDAINLMEKHRNTAENNLQFGEGLCDLYLAIGANRKCSWLVNQIERNLGSSKRLSTLKAKLLASQGKLDSAIDLLESKPEKVTGDILSLAVLALENGNLGLAEQHSKTLLASKENNPSFLNLHASVLLKQGRFDESKQVLKGILVSTPDYLPAQYNLALVEFNLGNIEESKSLSKQIAELNPNMLLNRILAARIGVVEGQVESSIEEFSLILQASPNQERVRSLLIDAYIQQGEFKDAKFEINKLLKARSFEPSLLLKRAKINIAIGDIKAAKADFVVLKDLFSDSVFGLLELAELQSSAKLMDDSLESLSLAYKIDNTNFFVLRQQVRSFLDKGALEKAQDRLASLTSNHPNEPDTHLLKGDIAFKLGRLKEAAKDYEQAFSINPNYQQAIHKRFVLASRGVSEANFKESFSKLLLSTRLSALVNNYLGDFYLLKEELDRALPYYQAAADDVRYQNAASVLNNIAYIYQRKANYTDAVKYAKRSLEIAPNQAAALDTLGWALSLMGEYSQGMSYLRESYSLNTRNLNTRYHIAYTLVKLDRESEAKRELSALLSLQQTFSKKEEAQQLLQSLTL